MNILMICENDPAGRAIALSQAINRYSEHSCRLITTTRQYNAGWEEDFYFPGGNIEKASHYVSFLELLNDADIIHFHVLADEHMVFSYGADIFTIRQKMRTDVKLIHHRHGHPDLRGNPEKYNSRYKKSNRTVLVSTPDLLKLIDNSVWLPNIAPFATDPLLSVATPDELPQDKIIICQAIADKPEAEKLKDTQILRDAVKELNDPRLELQIIKGLPNRECLKKKRKAHIVFDHMQGYFGVSSLESLAQGKVVMAGLNRSILYHMYEWLDFKFNMKNRPPWVIAQNKSDLKHWIKFYANNQDAREFISNYSAGWMRRWWGEQRIVNKLLEIYNK